MLGETLRLIRVFHDMKQNELAEKLDVSKSYVSEIEKNNKTPSLEVIQKYADTFKIPMSSILFFSENIEDAKANKDVSSKVKDAIATKIITFLRLIEQKTSSDNDQ